MSYITIIVYIMYYYITVIPMCYNIVIYYTIIVITIIMAWRFKASGFWPVNMQDFTENEGSIFSLKNW